MLIFSVFRPVIVKGFKTSCRRRGPIMRAGAYWFFLRLWFSLITPPWRFVQNVVVFSFVSSSRSIMFLLCYCFVTPAQVGVQWTIFMCLSVPQFLLSPIFYFSCRQVGTPLCWMSDFLRLKSFTVRFQGGLFP